MKGLSRQERESIKKPFIGLYIIFIGDVPVSAADSNDPLEKVIENVRNGISGLPENWVVRPVWQVSTADLERLKLHQEIRANAISLAQIATMLRGANSGLVIAPGDAVPPAGGGNMGGTH